VLALGVQERTSISIIALHYRSTRRLGMKKAGRSLPAGEHPTKVTPFKTYLCGSPEGAQVHRGHGLETEKCFEVLIVKTAGISKK